MDDDKSDKKEQNGTIDAADKVPVDVKDSVSDDDAADKVPVDVKDSVSDDDAADKVPVDVKDSDDEVYQNKKNFQTMYKFTYSLKMVIINNFKDEVMDNEVFRQWVKSSSAYDFTKKKDGSSECVLYYSTVAKGDGAYLDLKSNLGIKDIKVSHPMAMKSNIHKYWQDLAGICKLAKIPIAASITENKNIFPRMVLIENVPESVTEEDLVMKYTEAHNIICYPNTKGLKWIRLLEFTEEDEALKFISSHKNEEIGGVAVKLSSFHRASNEKKRIEEPYNTCTFSDEERVQKCEELVELQKEQIEVINRDDLFGEEKILQYNNLIESYNALNIELKCDTDYRMLKEQELPEEDEIKKQIAYSVFAESNEWVFSDRSKKAAQSYDIPFDRSKRTDMSRKRRKRKSDSARDSTPDSKKKRDDEGGKNNRFDKKKDNKRARSPLGARVDIRDSTEGKFEKDVCYKCGKKGHRQRDCKSEIACFKCGGSGHTTKDCTSYLPKGKGSGTGQCYNCKGEGHFARDCPSGWGGKTAKDGVIPRYQNNSDRGGPNRGDRGGPNRGDRGGPNRREREGRRMSGGNMGGGGNTMGYYRGNEWIDGPDMDMRGDMGRGSMMGSYMGGAGNMMDITGLGMGMGNMVGNPGGPGVAGILQTLSQSLSSSVARLEKVEMETKMGRRY